MICPYSPRSPGAELGSGFCCPINPDRLLTRRNVVGGGGEQVREVFVPKVVIPRRGPRVLCAVSLSHHRRPTTEL